VAFLIGVVLVLQALAIHGQSLPGDDAYHLLAGQQALLFGQNLVNYEHPPLVKLVAGLPVLLTGRPLAPKVLPDAALDAAGAMHRDSRRLWRTAVAARWLVLAVFGVPLGIACYALGRRFGGPGAGWLLLAMVGLSFPVVPWLASLQTDTAVALGFLLVLLAGLRWQEEPTWRWATLVGLAGGVALASKFSGLVLALPAVIAFSLAPAPAAIRRRRRLTLVLIALPLAAGILLASYAVANLDYDPRTGRRAIQQYCGGQGTLLGAERLAPLEDELLALERQAPVLSQLALGVAGVAAQNAEGVYLGYALGEVRSDGAWWYFPLALLLKTPLALLVAGAVVAVRRSAPATGVRHRREAVPILVAVAVYVTAAVSSSYNIGLRHLLPVLPLLGLPLALGLARRPRLARGVVLLLAVESLVLAPLWVPATNTWWLGEHNPTRFALGAGDVENRQGLVALAKEARRRGLRDLGVLDFGLHPAVLAAYLPDARPVRPGDPLPEGWYVVNVWVEQLVPAVLDGDSEAIYSYEHHRAVAERWEEPWRRIRRGEEMGWIAGTYHLYRVGPGAGEG
jgi:4-amino-4-deoxy-L-arabinose transferase-like glycosyltransferase